MLIKRNERSSAPSIDVAAIFAVHNVPAWIAAVPRRHGSKCLPSAPESLSLCQLTAKSTGDAAVQALAVC